MAERLEQALDNRLAEWNLAGQHAFGQALVDVFEVHMDDPVAGQFRHLDRIPPSQGDVARVEADPNVAGSQQPFDVVWTVDRHAPVGVQGRRQAPLLCDVHQAAQTAVESVPLLVGHLDHGVVSGERRRRSEHKDLGSGAGEGVGAAGGELELWLQQLWPVQGDRYEPADESELV